MSNSNYSGFPETNINNTSPPEHESNLNHFSHYATETNNQNLEPFDDHLVLPEGLLENDFASIFAELHQEVSPNNINTTTFSSTQDLPRGRSHEGGENRMKIDERKRIAFRTKSWVEIMDDGFKWRKYGKKAVKNNPNPRNYYRCSEEGCDVKKRVERDREDSSYVITTYEGMHNHPPLQ